MMGESGGRSEHNRTGQGAERKSTPRERSYVDPVRDGQDWESIEGEVFPAPGLSPVMVVIYAAMAVAAAGVIIALVMIGVWAAAVLGFTA